MAIMNFNTANQTFRQLLGNGLHYKVPSFQRDYSWSENEWDDLWQDICGLFDTDVEAGHYMGYLVLQSADSKNFGIIDGQQRLTTISIMILAALGNLKKLVTSNINSDINQRRLDQLRQSYIGYTDPVTLVSRPKLELNRHNNTYYATYIVPLEKLRQRGFKASEHLLRKSYEWFDKQFDAYVRDASDKGEKLAIFVDSIVDKLFFTVITVTDELNAFTVFETLNARGVRLSSTDLLKNYLFSLLTTGEMHNAEIQSLEDLWEGIITRLGKEDFSEFLRVFWNSKHKLVRKTELFKVVRHKIRDKGHAFQLLRDLDATTDVYMALRDAHDPLWNDKEKSAIRLFKLAQTKQQNAIILALYEVFYKERREVFTRVIADLSTFVFRYNVICKLHTNEQERLYSKIGQGISSGAFSDAKRILNALRELYPDDDIFKAAFTKKEFMTTNARNKAVVRYIFTSIEKNAFSNDFNIESDTYNIEHILPEKFSESLCETWPEFTEEQHKRCVYRLGNMTFLETKTNNKLGQQSYQAKAVEFEKSTFGMTQYIAKHYKTWDEDKIDSRQKHLAKAATGIWRIDF